MKEVISAITQSGLGETESRVYYTLLRYGELSVSSIAKHSNMSRANVYVILKKLDIMGLVSHSKIGKREFISAVHPHRLRQVVNLRRNRFEDDFEKLKTLYQEGNLHKPKVQIFEGIESVRLIYKEIWEKLREKEELCIFTNIGVIKEKFPEVVNEFQKIIGQVVYNSNVRELSVNDEESHLYHNSIKSKIGEGYRFRVAQRDLAFGENEQFILKDKIIYFSLQKNIFVIIIENEDLVKTHQVMFDMAWEQSTVPKTAE